MNAESDEPASESIDARDLDAKGITEKLNSIHYDSSHSLEVQLGDIQDGIGSGLNVDAQLRLEGDVGAFAFLLNRLADTELIGSAGICCGHSFSSGSLLVTQHVGDCLGAFATGGFIAVHGSAGDRCGLNLSGGDIFVRSKVGDEAGCSMNDGVIVLGNGAGEQLGQGMTGGVIYVRGEVASLSDSVREVRFKDADGVKLGLLLARGGVKGAVAADFKAYRPRNVRS